MSLLIAAIAMLILMGNGGLATPSVLEPAAWPTWARGREPLSVAFAILRLVGLAVAWYLLGVTTIGILARVLRWVRLVELADILTVAWVRNLLQSALGLGLATAAVTGATLGHRPVEMDRPRATIAAAVPTSSMQFESEVEPEVARPLPPALVPDSLAPVLGAPQSSADTYLVKPGDHFWTIAEQVLAQSWGRAVTEDEIMPFWQQLVEVNRSGLIDPGNPDLILPGQYLTIPASPTAP
ncbi:MAG: LysM peptidoglycan-binding domain-containing protein [Egibacteraceae bacterium]